MKDLKKLYYWIPSLYFMEALPYILVTVVSPILYKSFGFSNTRIAFYTSLLTIPWLAKPVLAPMAEMIASKRVFTVTAQFALVALYLLLGSSLSLTNFFYVSLVIFFMIAITSSIHDMNADGLYIITLNEKAQAHFIGIRTLFYQIGKLACQGGLVSIAGFLIVYVGHKAAWQISLVVLMGITLIIALYHTKILPKSENKISHKAMNAASTFRTVFADLINSPHALAKITFVVFYNLSDAQLLKIVPLFLIEKVEHGGLGLSITEVGLLYGGIGAVGMLLGVTLSGLLLSRISLKACLVPLTLFAALADAGYLVGSYYGFQSVILIGFIIVLAQFGFGLINGAYMLYLVRCFAQGKYPMSMYAIGTALMGLGVTLGGMISGYMQSRLGYTGFFCWILLADLGNVLLSVYNSKKVL